MDNDDDDLLNSAEKIEQIYNDNNFEISFAADDTFTRTQPFIPEFDVETGQSWHYPIDLPQRQYQYNIVQKSLYKNTLVVLPTGLGKTFISSVVMYNFHRWYPQSIVLFLAPTKPLVSQQTLAFRQVTNLPSDVIVEMTGSTNQIDRVKLWLNKGSIFMLTPQTLLNDLNIITDIAKSIKCIVFDEAHKATGNYAYCQIIRTLIKHTRNFRVLALSATPGTDIQSIQQVVTNLLIANIEVRTEDSLDVRPYIKEKSIETIIVPLTTLMRNTINLLSKMISPYKSRLESAGLIHKRCMYRFSVLQARNLFKLQKDKYSKVECSSFEKDFLTIMSVMHGIELLSHHGFRSLYFHFKNALFGDKSIPFIKSQLLLNEEFRNLFNELRMCFESCSQSALSEERIHPKLIKAKEIIKLHFANPTNNNSRIIVFSQYRESVHEITELLNRERPLIRPVYFTGQSVGLRKKGITQKEQSDVIRMFIAGTFNTLVATCVAEEGLDIGEVDLIVCFDTNKSPVRMIQRMGRTGRRRTGRIVVLLTEGKEANSFTACKQSKKRITSMLSDKIKKIRLYTCNPRLVPEQIDPVCKLIVTANKATDPLANQSRDKFKRNAVLVNKEEVYFWRNCIKPSSRFRSWKYLMTLQTTKQKEILINSGFKSQTNKALYRIMTSNPTYLLNKHLSTENDFIIDPMYTSLDLFLNKSRHSSIPKPTSILPNLPSRKHQLNLLSKCLNLKESDEVIIDFDLPKEHFNKKYIWFHDFTINADNDFRDTVIYQRSASPILGSIDNKNFKKQTDIECIREKQILDNSPCKDSSFDFFSSQHNTAFVMDLSSAINEALMDTENINSDSDGKIELSNNCNENTILRRSTVLNIESDLQNVYFTTEKSDFEDMLVDPNVLQECNKSEGIPIKYSSVLGNSQRVSTINKINVKSCHFDEFEKSSVGSKRHPNRVAFNENTHSLGHDPLTDINHDCDCLSRNDSLDSKSSKIETDDQLYSKEQSYCNTAESPNHIETIKNSVFEEQIVSKCDDFAMDFEMSLPTFEEFYSTELNNINSNKSVSIETVTNKVFTSKVKRRFRKHQKPLARQMLMTQAIDENEFDLDDDITSQSDDNSFIDDSPSGHHVSDEDYAMYVTSLRKEAFNVSQFKGEVQSKYKELKENESIDSQDCYILDSFCVDSADETVKLSSDERSLSTDSILEIPLYKKRTLLISSDSDS